MHGKLAFFKDRLLGSGDGTETPGEQDSSDCVLFECPACGSVLIESSNDQCPQCDSAELVEV
ncbi:hypothetical protein G9464_17890 [Halostella sp. JP-L12]|uniref:hypothetical protein n=1 Tax=Halostella TaxID=1843185 RepID=UPI000EF763EC|nr:MULTISPECIES: hypothetical protein [Halostella]NHN49446.1 hypothetical protein [Halostella sp. JP-L12]